MAAPPETNQQAGSEPHCTFKTTARSLRIAADVAPSERSSRSLPRQSADRQLQQLLPSRSQHVGRRTLQQVCQGCQPQHLRCHGVRGICRITQQVARNLRACEVETSCFRTSLVSEIRWCLGLQCNVRSLGGRSASHGCAETNSSTAAASLLTHVPNG